MKTKLTRALCALIAITLPLSGCTTKQAGFGVQVALTPAYVGIGTVTWPLALPFGLIGIATSDGDEMMIKESMKLVFWPVGLPIMIWQYDAELNQYDNE